jgi:hypothetical protein
MLLSGYSQFKTIGLFLIEDIEKLLEVIKDLI